MEAEMIHPLKAAGVQARSTACVKDSQNVRPECAAERRPS